MKLSHIAPKFSDSRGEILDVLSAEQIDYVTIINSKKGAVRGNHFHRETLQWVYLLKGSLKVLFRMPGETVQTQLLAPGDLLLNECEEEHAIEALEDSSFLVLTRGPRGGDDYESDTYRLSEPLKDPKAS
jgi:quercetin dioxygenase-like cupin family protein